MKEIILIGSYCDTKPKQEALDRLLNQAKEKEIDTLVFARYPLPKDLQKKSTYYFHDSYNPVFKDRVLNHYLDIKYKFISNYFYDYGFAAIDQIPKALGIANNLGYDIAYWLVYDVNLSEGFEEYRKICLDYLLNTNIEAITHKFIRHSQSPKGEGIDGTSIAFKIHPSYTKLKGIITETYYRELLKINEEYISENILEIMFQNSELEYGLLENKPNLPATLTSTGIRKHGYLDSKEYPKTTKYLRNLNVGWDHIKGEVNIFSWDSYVPIQTISFQFDNGPSQTFQGKDRELDIYLNYKPLMLNVKSINEELIDEVIDLEYPEDYWHKFQIKNK